MYLVENEQFFIFREFFGRRFWHFWTISVENGSVLTQKRTFLVRNHKFLASLKNFHCFLSLIFFEIGHFFGQVCILGAVYLNWRKMFILMSLETGFDHNHFLTREIIVLFWLFHFKIKKSESFWEFSENFPGVFLK